PTPALSAWRCVWCAASAWPTGTTLPGASSRTAATSRNWCLSSCDRFGAGQDSLRRPGIFLDEPGSPTQQQARQRAARSQFLQREDARGAGMQLIHQVKRFPVKALDDADDSAQVAAFDHRQDDLHRPLATLSFDAGDAVADRLQARGQLRGVLAGDD